MLDALMAGRALTAGEVARVAHISASTASEHLSRLASGGVVEAVTQGGTGTSGWLEANPAGYR